MTSVLIRVTIGLTKSKNKRIEAAVDQQILCIYIYISCGSPVVGSGWKGDGVLTMVCCLREKGVEVGWLIPGSGLS